MLCLLQELLNLLQYISSKSKPVTLFSEYGNENLPGLPQLFP